MNENLVYEVLLEEIKRHTEDAQFSKATQFVAANRLENKYQFFLFPGFFITILGVSSLFGCISKGVCIACLFNLSGDCDILSHIIAFLGVCITVWPLIKDYSGKAALHRRFAEQYNEITKQCLNWKTDYPPGSDSAMAKTSVLTLRDKLSIINSLSPYTTSKDYEIAKKNIENGAYIYDQKTVVDTKKM